MTISVDAGGWEAVTEVKGAADYVRLELPGTTRIANYVNGGVQVINLHAFQGSYNSGGVQTINQSTFVSSVVSSLTAESRQYAIEVLNEPGGSWFWGGSANSDANALAYANLLKAVHDALVSNFGSGHPPLLASFDGGESGAITWGQRVMAQYSGIMDYVDGITCHPYGGTSDRTASALGNRSNIAAAYAASGNKPVWLTELGWPTAEGQGNTGDSFQWSEAEQVTNIQNFVAWARAAGYIAHFTSFNFTDYGTNTWYGIRRTNETHKPSYDALRALV